MESKSRKKITWITQGAQTLVAHLKIIGTIHSANSVVRFFKNQAFLCSITWIFLKGFPAENCLTRYNIVFYAHERWNEVNYTNCQETRCTAPPRQTQPLNRHQIMIYYLDWCLLWHHYFPTPLLFQASDKEHIHKYKNIFWKEVKFT